MKLKGIKGMRDITGDEVSRFQYLEDKARQIFRLYRFSEIRTPILERTDLFTHGVGEDTDIVGKEMYLLEDRRGTSLALRPENTAPVVRLVINQNLLKQNKVLRYYYMGPMFRYENSQKGRYRQFHQIGVECFGLPGPEADLEIFLMLQQYFEAIELADISFQINSIGCCTNENCRPAYKTLLQKYLSKNLDHLCEICLRRKDKNPLRVFDCKVPKCINLMEHSPSIQEYLCETCDTHFVKLQNLLHEHQIKFDLNPKLVRGLDYYSRTVFEIYAINLGAQNAAGGGGRYDNLFEVYGADLVPAIGFALGLDRLSILTQKTIEKELDIFVVGSDKHETLRIVSVTRKSGYTTTYDPFISSMKSQFRQANKEGAKFALVLGEDEIKNHKISIKDMKNGDQSKVNQDKLVETLNERMKTEGLKKFVGIQRTT